ncbi:hypothetical protein ANN_03061 [Periplaneta americana]|uniref:Uncharacterized protein n=1 Tax=Periplaneta americana TaxID=6978 RepID=A0ABQ8U179_PERAM|nr:hypothetical protein ANN_03061 [Periplaneta americana]
MPSTWPGIEPATLGIDGQRYANSPTRPAYVCATDILEEFENQNRVCSCNMDCRLGHGGYGRVRTALCTSAILRPIFHPELYGMNEDEGVPVHRPHVILHPLTQWGPPTLPRSKLIPPGDQAAQDPFQRSFQGVEASLECSVANQYSLIEECIISDNEYGGGSHHKEKLKIQNNLVKIDVYFEKLRVKSIEQSPTYKVQTFIGSLGGALSLYLGITLLMLIEVVEALFRLFHSGLLHCRHKIFSPSQLTKPKIQKIQHQHRKTKIKIGNKLPQQVFFTGNDKLQFVNTL